MIKLFRNSEVCVTSLVFIGITVAAAVLMRNSGRLAPVLAMGASMLFTYIISAYIHYRRINDISGEIDKVLHGSDEMLWECDSEGELAILKSEIYKMTVRLREQSHDLMADKSALADALADISHQIRTPLTSINLVVTMLSRNNITIERRHKLLMELQELLSRIDWLITALLKMSKLDAGSVEMRSDELSLREVAEASSRPFLIPAEVRGQELKIEADGTFTGDLQWTCEALGNIIKNCTEHTPEGGTISIKASENTLYSEIVISDTGSGIAPEDLPHIFERFYKGSDSGDKSFGIGLALARMIISAQSGTIKAENSGSGAVFTVRFYKVVV